MLSSYLGRQYLIFLLVMAGIGCQSIDDIPLATEQLYHDTEIYLDAVAVINGAVMAVGGKTFTEARAIHYDILSEQIATDSIGPKRVFGLTATTDGLLGCGLDGLMYYYDGITDSFELIRSSEWQVMRDVMVHQDTIYVVAGKSLGSGYLYRLRQDYTLIDVTIIDQEPSAVVASRCGHPVVSVYGGMYIYIDDVWQIVDTPADFYTDVATDGAGQLLAVGLAGTIIESTDCGLTWTELVGSGRYRGLETIVYGDEHWYAGGTDGLLLRTTNRGLDWTDYRFEIAEDITDLLPYGGHLYASTLQGSMLRCSIP